MRGRLAIAVAALTLLVGHASAVCAQGVEGVEVTPFGGARFGNDFFEIETGQPVDVDVTPALGVVVDIPLSDGLQVEALFTHQEARFYTATSSLGPPLQTHVVVDHWQGGALQEFSPTQVRPFLTGMFGLTRYAAYDDNEFRFSLSAGGGVKLLPASHVGVRLEGRLLATFIDAHGSGALCGPGGCFLALNLNVVWQAEFTAGLVVKLPR